MIDQLKDQAGNLTLTEDEELEVEGRLSCISKRYKELLSFGKDRKEKLLDAR